MSSLSPIVRPFSELKGTIADVANGIEASSYFSLNVLTLDCICNILSNPSGPRTLVSLLSFSKPKNSFKGILFEDEIDDVFPLQATIIRAETMTVNAVTYFL